MKVEDINPYGEGADKSSQVERMFDTIAPAYDFMNNAMTFGMYRSWRNKALKAAIQSLGYNPGRVLDVATGTGDVAFTLSKLLPETDITGIDISEGMLSIARKKLSGLPPETQKRMAFGKGDTLMLPFLDGEFDLVTVAYGIRNFSDLRRGVAEMKRVLKTGGVLCIIELSCPTGKFTRAGYDFYSKKIIPFAGKLISGDSRAYSYLPESIAACPQREDMAALLTSAGFIKVEWKSLTFGAVTYYLAR